ncbi:MAG: PQQ-binding-like beta-propeller repeat protein [Thermoguttaceae bacterium]
MTGISAIAFAAVFGWMTLAVGRPASADSPAIARTEVAAESNADGPIASAEPDWPQWRGPRRDEISDEKGLLPTWPPAGPTLLWKIDGLGRGWSAPIVVGKRLYVTGDVHDDLVIFAFDLDGKMLWHAKNGQSWKGSYPGARACCVYSDGKLHHMNAHGRVACLQAATGHEIWAVDVLERFAGANITWAMSECLLVDGPRLIVTPGGKDALMAALDKTTGRTIWTTKALCDDRTSYCSPMLFRCAGQRILAGCSAAHGFGVNANDGRLLWTVPLRSPYGVNIMTPVYGGNKIFYTTPYVYGTCYQLQSGDAGPHSEKAWSTTLDTCTGTVLLADSLLYGSGYQKHKSWLCLDWKSGEVRYESKALPTGAAVYADGRLYCLAEDGRAALLKPTPGKFEIEGQFRLVPEEVHDAWAHPVLLHGRLYLRYHDALRCYDVLGRKQGPPP